MFYDIGPWCDLATNNPLPNIVVWASSKCGRCLEFEFVYSNDDHGSATLFRNGQVNNKLGWNGFQGKNTHTHRERDRDRDRDRERERERERECMLL